MGLLELRTNHDSVISSGPETLRQQRPALTTTMMEHRMAIRADITPELCRQLLRYEPETGRLYFRPRSPEVFAEGLHGREHQANAWNAKCANKLADEVLTTNGYRAVRIFKRRYMAHRIIWLMRHDRWPPDQLDHIDGDRANNRLANLREVDKFGNMRNQRLRDDNTSGICGVYWSTAANKWQAYIRVDGKMRYLGVFASLEAAKVCRRKAEIDAGFHANHGKPRRGYPCHS